MGPAGACWAVLAAGLPSSGARAARAASRGLWRGAAGGGWGGFCARGGVSLQSRDSVILGECGSARASVAGFFAVHFLSHAIQV